MEAIVPAFLLAVLSQIGERPPLLAAILADRYRRPFPVLFAALLAHLLGNAVAAAGAIAMAPMLVSRAQALFLAAALLISGIGAFWPAASPGRLAALRLGPFATPLLAIFAAAFGGSTQFFTLALGLGGEPWFAAAGSVLGAFAVALVAAVLGQAGWRALPLSWLRIGAGAIFLLAGAHAGLGAAGLL